MTLYVAPGDPLPFRKKMKTNLEINLSLKSHKFFYCPSTTVIEFSHVNSANNIFVLNAIDTILVHLTNHADEYSIGGLKVFVVHQIQLTAPDFPFLHSPFSPQELQRCHATQHRGARSLVVCNGDYKMDKTCKLLVPPMLIWQNKPYKATTRPFLSCLLKTYLLTIETRIHTMK